MPPTGATSDLIDLSGFTILIFGDTREKLTRPYTAGELAQLFLRHWVPHLECQKCGRHDYCKFTKPHPYEMPRRAGRLAEIQCGVVESMINNYVRGIFPVLGGLSKEELQSFLDGSYHLVQFVYETEQQIGSMISDRFIDWLGNDEYRAEFFGSTARLRKHLDRFAGEFRSVQPFRTKTTVILTEGSSEKAFLTALGKSGLLGLTDLDIQSYFGSGNRGPTKLRLLAERLHQDGYDLFIQGDADGNVSDIFDQLVRQSIVSPENTFAFKLDFESSFPAEPLYGALFETGMIEGVQFDDFDRRLAARPHDQAVVEYIEKQWNIQIDKIELAEALGEQLNYDLRFARKKEFWSSTEIGRFLDKIRRLP